MEILIPKGNPSTYRVRPAVRLGPPPPERVWRRALEFATAADNTGLTMGAQPSGFAAACIYLAGAERGYPLTQAEIADVAGTSVAMIRTLVERNL